MATCRRPGLDRAAWNSSPLVWPRKAGTASRLKHLPLAEKLAGGQAGVVFAGRFAPLPNRMCPTKLLAGPWRYLRTFRGVCW